MKFEDLKVGMMVQAIDEYYRLTTKSREWVGTVTELFDEGTFIAKTESSISIDEKNTRYGFLRPEHFEEVVAKKLQ